MESTGKRQKHKAGTAIPAAEQNKSRKRKATVNPSDTIPRAKRSSQRNKDREPGVIPAQNVGDDDGDDGDDIGGEDEDEEKEGYGDEHEFGSDFEDGIEEEVEERVYEFGPERSKLSFRIYTQNDPEDDSRTWLKNIHVNVNFEGKTIGYGLGRYVNRGIFRSRFRAEMEGPSQELCDVAFDLFNSHARLKRELINHPVRKGTGVWGKELDHGNFLVIENVHIYDASWRRKGIGTRIVRDVIDKSRRENRTPAFSLVSPAYLNSELEKATIEKTKLEKHEIRIHMQNGNVAFWRCQGFRRIGASDFFGLATDTSHPANTISLAQDFDPADPEPDLDDSLSIEEKLFSIGLFDTSESHTRQLELLKERLPLHHAVATLSDDDCVQFFSDFKANIDNKSYNWNKVDRHSKNVLHVAAQELKVKSVRWLLENVNEEQILSSHRTVDGYTPQECLESQLDSARSKLQLGGMTIDVSEKFEGYPASAIECLAAFQGLNNLSRVQHERLKFGCTCGSCIDGFLSTRMRRTLRRHAELIHDFLEEDIDDGKIWADSSENYTQYVAPGLRERFKTNKSLRQGFSNLFLYVAEVLRKDTPAAPYVESVEAQVRSSSEWPPCTRNFLERGRVESVLRTLFTNAKALDYGLRDDELAQDPVENFPECRNDHEFEFVISMCETH
ncbi:hypothetical protein AOL_s00043g258 [Orbilia oligospora ATCC 24927]|uniref:Uncharacterized protein n=1 Tax=Arthrobotrys oligospora (strain ATCC 24927 / CBS 115.81 / DSM 1491) TaxID=756982 RepID=G1X3I5_ARTOA|nr:hypothetical protein AOL_s00043g258 [Orbilia oligospora ATCC 24927]EGX52469.1 hypothetical protein AOL_s00043g258 [Orbilia oligospora ATCC 24927]